MHPAPTQPLVVLIPGLMCDATFWRAVDDALASSRRIHIPKLHDHDSLVAMATTILADTDGPLDVVGHSMGGRVALELWDQAPGRVQSLALLDTGVHPVGPDEPEQRQVLLDLAEHRGIGAVADHWIPGMVHPDRLHDHALIEAIRAMVTSYRPEQFHGQVCALLGRRDATPLLPAISCPTLVACGSHDAWSPPAQHRDIAAAISGARYAQIPSSGHMVAMERPADTAELIVEWLGAD